MHQLEKGREGIALSGTLADCVARWLSLAGHQQTNCTLGWGSTVEGDYGFWSASAIGSFVRRNMPPSMAAERGGQPVPEVLSKPTTMDRYDPPPGPHSTRPDPSRSQSGKA